MTEIIQTLKDNNIFSKDYCYLVMWLKSKSGYTIKQVSEALNVSERVAEHYIDRLEDSGLIDLGQRVDRKTRQKMSDIEPPEKTAALSLRFAYYVHQRLTKLHPDNLDLKKAYVDNWEKESRLLLAERNPKEVYAIFEFAVADEFWSKVILSMSNFRKKYDKIKVKTTTTKPQVQIAQKYLSDD